MIKQNKGKDLHKVPKSRVPVGPFYVSRKYDGHYVQLKHVPGQVVKMWTSGGKEFYLEHLAQYIETFFPDTPFHIECEFNYNCKGVLGDRGKSAILTTYRTNFSKGIKDYGNAGYDIFRVLDLVDKPDVPFVVRASDIVTMFFDKPWFEVPVQHKVQHLMEAKELAKLWVEIGFEGAMVKTSKHLYQEGKRSNDIIKIKPRLTADLLCTDWKEGTGKYEGMIGSLLLVDSTGREVWAGSGLSDDDRICNPDNYIGCVVEIEYESMDTTYIQPIIKEFRLDKTKEEID